MNKKALVLDLELTCWDTPTDNIPEIIQIGIVEVDLIKRTISRKKMMYVIPVKTEVSDFCTSLTGITKKQVYKQGLSYEKALEILNEKFGFKNKTVFGWGHDDKAFKDGINNYINLSALYSMMKMTDKKYGLEMALKEEGIAFEGNAHDALVDAENTAVLLLKILNSTKLNEPIEKICKNCIHYSGFYGSCLSEEAGFNKTSPSNTCDFWEIKNGLQ